MKKIILILSFCLLMATNGYASCADGTEVTGKNGHVYCRSNVIMNWYSAFAWCDAHGRTLATVEQDCDIDETQKWDGNVGDGKCLNMIDVKALGYAWALTPYGTNEAFHVEFGGGGVRTVGRIGNQRYALCW